MSKFAWGLVTAGFVLVALIFIGFSAYAKPLTISMGADTVGLDTRNWSTFDNVTDCECTGCYVYVGPFFKRWQ